MAAKSKAGRSCDPSPGLADAAIGLDVSGIRHAFGSAVIVRDASLTVGPGKIVCLLGPSGCGKTTLLRLAAGLERLQEGRITIGGRIVACSARGIDQPPETRRVGLMFQDYALFPHLTVTENVRFGLRNTADSVRWTRNALQRTGLAAVADAYPHTLSGGQQQRCALLRAIAPHPDVLLLDEPFSGLDVTMRSRVRGDIAGFLRETNIPTLIVTHDPEEAMSLGDHLAVMRNGHIVQQGTPAEIYLSPADPFVASLFGPLNEWPGTVRDGHLDTPIGNLSCRHLPDGTEAVAMVRPDGIRLDADGRPATVLDSRLLGCFSAVSLAIAGDPRPVKAWLAGVFLPAPGTPLSIAVDPGKAFVFPTAATL